MNPSIEDTAAPSLATAPAPAPVPETSRWVRRLFQAPPAAWVPDAVTALTGLPALPSLRGLRREPDGPWTVEEYHTGQQFPLGQFLTQSAAPVWVFVSIVQQCLAGLLGLHQKGLRHGAIRPDTLKVNPSGHVLLCGLGGGDPWETGPAPAAGGFPPLPGSVALQDLSDLGKTFRAVLGGDALQRLTSTRTDIAPLVAEWIDWLADPEPGHEPTGAAQAAAIFNDIRAGRPGIRPWKHIYDLPPEVAQEGGSGTVTTTGKGADPLKKRRLVAHGIELNYRAYLIFAAVFTALLVGVAWLASRYFKQQELEETPAAITKVVLPNGKGSPGLLLPEELLGMFDLTGGDTEPLAGTGEAIQILIETLKKNGNAPEWDTLESERKLREAEAAQAARGEHLPARGESDFLNSPDVFPSIGSPTAGRMPGDYYLVWRTQNFILTEEEVRTVQSAILRTARYCGLRVMAWAVLPNHAGVVLRVPPRRVITDENIERRIAILRGEKTAAGVISQINAKLKEGDDRGADQIRLKWLASMGSAAGFFSVIRTVPVVDPGILGDRPLWRDKPLRFAVLNPQSSELFEASGCLDNAAVKGLLCRLPHEWPYCSLAASLVNYGPSLRATSVIMQRDPQMSLPVPGREELLASLEKYRRRIKDLPEEVERPGELTDSKISLPPPPGAAVPVSGQAPSGRQ